MYIVLGASPRPIKGSSQLESSAFTTAMPTQSGIINIQLGLVGTYSVCMYMYVLHMYMYMSVHTICVMFILCHGIVPRMECV